MEFISNLPLHTLLFIGIMLVVGLYIHLAAFNAKAVAHGPTIFMTFGIFATFVGIALGLLHFNVNNIQESVPALLDGLKMAFWASVFGVGIALTLKVRYAIWGVSSKHQDGEVYGATIDDLVNQMSGIQRAIVGNDDSTLLSQMKLSRQDANDRLDALKRSQEAFMEKMADNNSKALIQALEEVMRDFNTKINEQFGDNFKHLNLAIEKILVWQEQYRQQMAEMIEQQTKTASNMETATTRYAELLNQTEKFNTVAERLAVIIETLDVQRNQIEQSLTSLAKLLTAASGSLPEVEKKILDLTDQMTRGVRTSNEESSKAVRETTTALQSTVADMRKMMVDMVQTTNQDFNAHITTITNKTKEQVAALDIALEQELTKSLDTLARQLTALSQRFVEDYTPLTERLRQVLTIGAGV
jgi:chromosome segregation ATPase